MFALPGANYNASQSKYSPMKTRLLTVLASASCLVLLDTGCSKKEQVTQVQPAPVARVTPVPPDRQVVVPPQPVVVAAAASWEAIKDCTYDQRADFFAGVARLQSQLDGQVADLNAKRAAMTADTKEWDFNMGEMTKARSYMISIATDVRGASPDTWNDEKDKVGQAWVRAQDAYDKVRTSTTN
jgi:hypothetical protein